MASLQLMFGWCEAGGFKGSSRGTAGFRPTRTAMVWYVCEATRGLLLSGLKTYRCYSQGSTVHLMQPKNPVLISYLVKLNLQHSTLWFRVVTSKTKTVKLCLDPVSHQTLNPKP